VAEESSEVVGWVHVLVQRLLVVSQYAEIGGLIVDEHFRARGIGRALMSEAERWALACGCTVVRLRSNTTRSAARDFYKSLGYEVTKTSFSFCKYIGFAAANGNV